MNAVHVKIIIGDNSIRNFVFQRQLLVTLAYADQTFEVSAKCCNTFCKFENVTIVYCPCRTPLVIDDRRDATRSKRSVSRWASTEQHTSRFVNPWPITLCWNDEIPEGLTDSLKMFEDHSISLFIKSLAWSLAHACKRGMAVPHAEGLA